MTDFANTASAQMPHAIVTPHLGASTHEAEDNCAVMAANELADYLENGNIQNSVNFPSVDLGPISTPMRLAVFHKNVPQMISKITSMVSSFDANIANMSDKNAGENAYMLLELDDEISADEVARVSSIDEVFRVREIRPQA